MRRLTVPASLAVVFISSTLIGAGGGDQPVAPLEFRIHVEKGDAWSPDWVRIDWELQNVSDRPVYVCQWPGPAFSHGWDSSEGIRQGVGRGYPHTQKLSRKFFVELKPGEAILGSTQYQVPATPNGKVDVNGTYRSGQTGGEFNLKAWVGEADADGVEIEVTKAPPTAPKQGD